MIVGVGTDVVDVARLTGRLARSAHLGERLFTPEEAASRGARPASLAACFAAKEAVLKVLGSACASQGVPVPRWRYTQIVVTGGAHQPPGLTVSGAVASLAEQLGVCRWHLSVSHDGGTALAVVVAEGQPPGSDLVATPQ